MYRPFVFTCRDNKRQSPHERENCLFGTPGGIRTHGLPLRRRPLYPTELRVQDPLRGKDSGKLFPEKTGTGMIIAAERVNVKWEFPDGGGNEFPDGGGTAFSAAEGAVEKAARTGTDGRGESGTPHGKGKRKQRQSGTERRCGFRKREGTGGGQTASKSMSLKKSTTIRIWSSVRTPFSASGPARTRASIS